MRASSFGLAVWLLLVACGGGGRDAPDAAAPDGSAAVPPDAGAAATAEDARVPAGPGPDAGGAVEEEDAGVAPAEDAGPSAGFLDAGKLPEADGGGESDPCAPSPCAHGRCIPAGSSFTCECETGWSGASCDQGSVCTTVCCDEACAASSPAPDLLVVTRPMFVEALKSFVDWKLGRGQVPGVLTLEWIGERYRADEGRLLAERLKQALREFKARGTRFALLVGDTRVDQVLDAEGDAPPGAHLQMDSLAEPWNVPTGYYYRNVPGESSRAEEYTDVFFADLADWDPDGDGLNDAIDSVQWDLAGMMLVGRWPGRTAAEVVAIAEKTREEGERAAAGEMPRSWVVLSDAVFGTADVADPTCEADYADPANAAAWWIKAHKCESGRLGASRALAAAGFAMTRRAFARDPTIGTWADAPLFRQLFFGAEALLTQGFHGTHAGIGAPLEAPLSQTPFERNFAVFDSASCLVGTYYSKDGDSFNEMAIKVVPGPAAVVSPENTYRFFARLAGGASLGEAFCASKITDRVFVDAWKASPASWLGSGNGLTLQGSDNLLGDPSLVFYPTAPPLDPSTRAR